MSQKEPEPADQEHMGPKTDDGFSQFVARIFGQLSRSSWLPAIMLVGNLVLIFQLRSQGNLDFGQAVVVFAQQPLGFLIVLIFSAVVVNIMTQAFETEVLRLLEGHWGSAWFIRGIAALMTRRQLRHYRKLDALLDHYSRRAFEIARENMLRHGISDKVMNVLERIIHGEAITDVDQDSLEKARYFEWRNYSFSESVRRMDSITSRMGEYPVASRILPTKLGNILRAGQDALSPNFSEFSIRHYPVVPDQRLHYKATPRMYVELDQLLSNLRTYGLLIFFFCGLAIVSPAMLVNRWSDLRGGAVFAVIYGILAITSYQSAIACARRYVGALSFADSLASASSRD